MIKVFDKKHIYMISCPGRTTTYFVLADIQNARVFTYNLTERTVSDNVSVYTFINGFERVVVTGMKRDILTQSVTGHADLFVCLEVSKGLESDKLNKSRPSETPQYFVSRFPDTLSIRILK